MNTDNHISRTPSSRAAAQIADETILNLFFRRIDDAISLTKTKYGALCRSVAFRILADSRDAEECENDTYLRAWNAIPPERPRALGAYLARITRNLALDRLDYNTAAARSSALTQAFEEFEPWLPARLGDPEAASENLAFRRVLNDFLRRQSAEARTIFLRRYWYGESIREIAEALGVSESKVKTSLFRTRERLLTELIKERIEL
ncbi:MAG: sigma-70 family RNA polymerase sigma factor [Ruminococcaceae bacterium]|nr:sigma-70 family RNA polymerase sigma factor [Oscillospiraceae bacterium]